MEWWQENQQLKYNYEAIVPVSIQVPRQPDPAQLHQKFTKILISLNLGWEVRLNRYQKDQQLGRKVSSENK